jgi:hypothetical protein
MVFLALFLHLSTELSLKNCCDADEILTRRLTKEDVCMKGEIGGISEEISGR